MYARRAPWWASALFIIPLLAGCGGGGQSAISTISAADATLAVTRKIGPSTAVAPRISRPNFVGAFFRPLLSPPYGVFAITSPGIGPAPYPTPGSKLFGSTGYCDQVAINGKSISTGYIVDKTKLADIVNLGVRWTRTESSSFFDDLSHIFGAGVYTFADFDSAQCSLERNDITPVIGLDAGPVQYNAIPGTISPTQEATYQSAADFGTWCNVVAAHEKAIFPDVTKFSLPGNEVDSNPGLFPGGPAQIAAYSEACYAAIKNANPKAFVYGFELNMDGGIDVPAFISTLAALGCKAGTCYDGIAMHISLVYPIPPSTTPCYPAAGAAYGMACVSAVESAAHVSHVLISETVYTVPGSVPDEATKALAVVAEYTAFAQNSTVDGVSYANVDECAVYLTGFFSDGCLISTGGQNLPAYTALRQLTEADFR